jgi:NAD(P)-dependent dehydrogenase (short-subunit alcohol dehydrogenase family)
VPPALSHGGAVENVARTALAEFGRLDVWINNAGVGALGPFERVPLHDPQDVVETPVRLAAAPKDTELWCGAVKILLKRVAPGLSESMTARQMHKTQMEQSPPAPDIPRAVQAPVSRGTGVSAGRRNAVRSERAA